MLKYNRNVLKTLRYDSVLSPLFFFFNLIKTAAKFMRNESVKARAVFANSADFEFHPLYLGPSNFWSEIVLKNQNR